MRTNKSFKKFKTHYYVQRFSYHDRTICRHSISFVFGQIFWALLVLLHSVTLFMVDATTNLRTFLVEITITIDIITVTTNLIHLITESFFLPPSNLIFEQSAIWNVLGTIILGPMCRIKNLLKSRFSCL